VAPRVHSISCLSGILCLWDLSPAVSPLVPGSILSGQMPYFALGALLQHPTSISEALEHVPTSMSLSALKVLPPLVVPAGNWCVVHSLLCHPVLYLGTLSWGSGQDEVCLEGGRLLPSTPLFLLVH
jgi:hypothetical protein